jgi:hypothetical protein
MKDIEPLSSPASQVQAKMIIHTDSVTYFSLSVESVRRVVSYAIHHYATVRAVAFQALVDCGYVEEVVSDSEDTLKEESNA